MAVKKQLITSSVANIFDDDIPAQASAKKQLVTPNIENIFDDEFASQESESVTEEEEEEEESAQSSARTSDHWEQVPSEPKFRASKKETKVLDLSNSVTYSSESSLVSVKKQPSPVQPPVKTQKKQISPIPPPVKAQPMQSRCWAAHGPYSHHIQALVNPKSLTRQRGIELLSPVLILGRRPSS